MYGIWCAGASVLNTLVNLNLSESKERIVGLLGLATPQLIWFRQVLLMKTSVLKQSVTAPLVGAWTAYGIYKNKNTKKKRISFFR